MPHTTLKKKQVQVNKQIKSEKKWIHSIEPNANLALANMAARAFRSTTSFAKSSYHCRSMHCGCFTAYIKKINMPLSFFTMAWRNQDMYRINTYHGLLMLRERQKKDEVILLVYFQHLTSFDKASWHILICFILLYVIVS